MQAKSILSILGTNGLELPSFFLIFCDDVVDITVGHAEGRIDNSLGDA